MNRKILFNDGWKFSKSDLDEKNYKQLEFEKIDIPHDYLIYDSLNLYEDSIGWYKKEFIVTKEDIEKEIIICFDGVYMDSTLYVNDKVVGQWKYGYSSFEFDITSFIKEGNNEVLVKVVHQNPNSRWYSGAGIYRDVWLKIRDKNNIKTNGIYVSIKEEEKNWSIYIDTTLQIHTNCKLKHSVIYKDVSIYESESYIEKNSDFTAIDCQKINVNNPLLWSTENPNLYKLKSELFINNDGKDELIEVIYQNIGFRKITFDHDKGLFLNGNNIKIQGVCEHHDLGALGAAFNKYALKRRFLILKDMGVNAIRTAHNMPAPELMDLADEMGFLILSEAFDMWERPKTKYDYSRFFKEYALVDVEKWVTRDRNHPSLFMWSIGNEIYDTHADAKRGQEITKMLMNCVKKYDYRENTKVTLASNYMPWENTQKCADIVKIAGYNYGEKYYNNHHEKYKDWIIYGSETASVVQSRGVYHFPFNQSILADDDEQCSCLGNSCTSWGAKNPESCIITERDTKYSLGQFIWTGFDYIGEPTPYHTKNSYFGQIDTATFKKDSYYIYQAEWTYYKKNPMIHIFPYWDFNKNQNIDVRVCSNAPKIQLIFNNKLIGTFKIDHKNGNELVKTWTIPYEEGKLKAIAYDEKDNIIAIDEKQSFKDVKEISLTSDKKEMIADGLDLIFLEISMKDENGNIVENANNRVTVDVEGEGRLIGLDNGDSTDYDSYKGISRRLFNGKLMAIIASTIREGNISVSVNSKDLKTKKIVFKSVKPNDNKKYIDKFMCNKEKLIVTGKLDEIPIRKIEIVSKDGQHFDENKKEIMLQANIYPQDASYNELEWSVVNDSGIISNIAKIEYKNNDAKVTALGDGEFRVRCTSKNGTDKVKLISELEFKSEGLGTAYKNPYEFISAGLYDFSIGEVGNGNERGVSAMRDGDTVIGFNDIDFGEYGSDLITIPIFTLNNESYSIQIYEGNPKGKNSVLLADVIYQKESIWNVYQEETYKLSKRLKGITSISFVAHAKFHIKGFTFKKLNKAFNMNFGSDCNKIYGDSFILNGDRIENIGNNVSLEFKNMNFGKDGVSKIIICGNSSIDKNTIHVQFENEKGSIRQLIEFSHTNGYEEKIFELERINGIQNVTLIFLPGSKFDFKWLKFYK